jgi:Carboxypeptidase regulatory-like domain
MPRTAVAGIRGTIRGPHGARIDDVTVDLSASFGFSRTQRVAVSPGGSFAIERVPAGSYHLAIVADHGHRSLDLEVPAGTIPAIEVELQPLVTITGRVVGSSKQPIANARIAVKHRPWSPHRDEPRTDREGAFELPGVPPGEVELLVSAREDPRKRHVPLTIADDPDGRVELGEIELDIEVDDDD